MKNSPNILLITADQWRHSALSTLGHPVVKTPNLDALAADGTLFTSHFTQCMPCGPARASLLTGMYLMNHRSIRNGSPLDARFTNVALETRKIGYDPSLIGYTDTTLDPRLMSAQDPAGSRYCNVLPGFTQVYPDGKKPWWRDLAKKGYAVPDNEEDIYEPVNNYPRAKIRGKTFAPPIYRKEDSDTAFEVNRAMDVIRDADVKPWFLHLSLLRPHPPFIAPEPYNSMYHPDDIEDFVHAESISAEAAEHPYTAFLLRHHFSLESNNPASHQPEESEMRQLRATYYGLMSEVDHQLGRLIAQMKADGSYENTLIIFTSDHGEQLWDHWMLGKESCFDQSARIPLIIRKPGASTDSQRGLVYDRFTENVDLMPTILDLLGHEIPLQCDGHSLRPFLEGKVPENWRQQVHWEMDFRNIGTQLPQQEMGIAADQCYYSVIRDRQYKYVHFAALPPLLYDIASDPGEKNNLANDAAYAGVIAEYAQKMLSWRMTHAERTLTRYTSV
ncbi:MAG: arylsulfatase A-like enzyme [Planctomycetota bacterium]|jgi:arylsulfatase A-like enzyme